MRCGRNGRRRVPTIRWTPTSIACGNCSVMIGYCGRLAATSSVSSRAKLDAARFQALVAEARRAADAGDQDVAGSILSEGLALWRGPAWGDIRDATTVSRSPKT